MTSKDKEHRLSKLKQFFGVKSSGGVIKEKDIWPELEKELRPETPVANRCKTLVELGDFVLNTKLEYTSVSKLWELTKDLIVDNKPTEHRQTTLTFYRKLIEGQYNNLSVMREHFFIIIQKHEVEEDLKYRLDLLIALTENGRDISYFEDKIVRFMLQWVPAIIEANYIEIFLEMLGNIIKYNTSHLDNEVVIGIVQMACNLSCTVDNTDMGLQCLNILEIVILCYPRFPTESLQLFVMTLCRTVNLVPYCQLSWKNMKHLLSTHLGYSALVIMCNILNDKSFYEDVVLLRGAVFHVNMGTFGSGSSLHLTPEISTRSTVLASFLHALECQKIIVTYEVILSMQMMIPKFGKELPEHIWDIVCDIFFAIADNIRYYESNGQSKDFILQKHFHETIDIIETMSANDEILINPEHVYNLIEAVSESRPEISVLNLIDYRSSKVTATRPEWLQVLHEFVQRFYRIPRTKIRIKTIQSLVAIMDLNRASYEEEVLERVVIPEFSEIATESDMHVRIVVSKALIDFALHCDTKRCGELLDILQQIIIRPFEQYAIDETVYTSENEVPDIVTVIEGLISIFQVKLYRLPSCHAVRIFDMLVGHLETHYQKPKVFEQVNSIRNKIFKWMLRARANSTYRIGFPELNNPNKIIFSHYLGIDSSLPLHGINYQQPISSQSSQETIPTMNYTTISIRRACRTIVTALESDRDYSIFQFALKELPNIMKNKALIQGNDIESLAIALLKCRSMAERKFAFNFVKPTSDEYNALILPAIASLVIYYQFLPPQKQLNIMDALKGGIYTTTAKVCINALTIMVLEMPETLIRKLNDVLLDMSKMPDGVNVAIPILEFLSILCRLPNHLFVNFTPLQYMYIFAIILRYTKPNRYDHYTVALAHHTVAGWFLKCKLSFRKNFIKYIFSSIQSNATLLLQDLNELTRNISRNDLSSLNEDSSNRKRSTSLTERGSRARDNPSDIMRPLMNDNSRAFHAELAETCIDFVARNTFSPCDLLPERLPAADNLLKDGPSQTWIVGYNLVTITTNTCLPFKTRNGLCQYCGVLGTQHSSKSETTATGSIGDGLYSPDINNANQKLTDVPPDFVAPKRLDKVLIKMTNIDLSDDNDSNGTEEKMEEETVQSEVSNIGGGSSEPAGNIINQSGVGSISPEPILQQHHQCPHFSNGWAEVMVRRPTGNVSWVMRIQNPITDDYFANDMSGHDLIQLLMPKLYGGVFGIDFLSNGKVQSSTKVSDTVNIVEKEVKPDLKEWSKPDVADNILKMVTLENQNEPSSESIYNPENLANFKTVSNIIDESESNKKPSYEDNDSFAVMPLRRVNSSPDVSSNFLETLKSSGHFLYIEPVIQVYDIKDKEFANLSSESESQKVGGEDIIASLENPELDKEIILPLNDVSIESEIETSATTTNSHQKSVGKPKKEFFKGSVLPRLNIYSSSLVINSTDHMSESERVRGRSNTISGIREINNANRRDSFQSNPLFQAYNVTKPAPISKSDINPSFIFLQLFHTEQFQINDQPIKVPLEMLSHIDSFDQIPPFETHKITVLYVGRGQTNEVDILKNHLGSTRYITFLQTMATLVRIKDAKKSVETNVSEGMYNYIWRDIIEQVTFHVTTLMPNKETDPSCIEKKNVINNNYVSIVYNESGEEFKLDTIKGPLNYACVVVQPIELNTNRIIVLSRSEISKFTCHSEPIIVSDRSAPLMARQLALHANLASQMYQSLKIKVPYASNWLKRLRKIKQLRTKLINDNKTHNNIVLDDTSGSYDDISNNHVHNNRDFTKYT